MSKSNICKKCKNKVACALGDTKGSSKYFSEGKEQISFYYSVDSAYDYKVILIAESDDTVIAKETMIFDSIEVNEDINVLQKYSHSSLLNIILKFLRWI